MDLGSLIDVEEMVRFIEEEEEVEVEVFFGGTLEVEAREWPPLLITGLADLLDPLEVEELALVLLLLLLFEVLLVEAFPVELEKDEEEEEEEDEEEEAELLEALEVVLEAAEAVVCCGTLANSTVLTRRGGRSSMRYLKRIGSF